MNKEELARYSKTARRIEKDLLILSVCKDKHVLDVGCIGQDRNYVSENWLHNKVKKTAAKADGVDILLEEIAKLNQQGYSMYSIDKLTETGNRYDIILMADVIEHVNDPVEFLRFYASFMNDGGLIIVSTPNSNRSNNFINILFNNNYSVNDEHTFWFCPRTLAEVVSRAGLNINDFYWVNQYYTGKDVKGFYQKFKLKLISWLASWRSNFNPNMIFILSKR